MGWFSTKKKHIVDTSVVRIVEDDLVPKAIRTALVESIFNETDLVDEIQNQALHGTFRNFNRMYRYAERGEYFYGLPDAKVLTSSDGFPIAQAQLEAEIGYSVTLDYMHFRPLNNFHAGWKHITESWAYDHDTNEIVGLAASYGAQVYLDRMVAVIETAPGQEAEDTSMMVFGTSASAGPTPERPAWAAPSVLTDMVIGEEVRIGTTESEAIDIHVIWTDGNGVVQRDVIVITLTNYDSDQEYYQARYRYTVGVDEFIGYWIYDPLTGPNTALNDVFETPSFTNPGTYFPFAVFRSEGQNRGTTARENTDEYKTTEKLLSYLDIDYREVSDALHEDEDINDIDQAVMMMAVPINSSNEVEIDYLFRYFSDLQGRLPSTATSGSANPTNLGPRGRHGSGGRDTSHAIQITDADFDMTISFDSITKKSVAGNLGPIGTVTNDNIITTESFSMRVSGLNLSVSERANRTFRKQISLHVYEEITVHNPKVRYRIYKNKGAEAGATDDRLLIPLDYNIVREMPVLHVEELYYRSLHFVFNSHVVQKTKWYQRGAFKVILIIIAIVITVLTWGSTWELIVAAFGIGVAAGAFLLMKILLGYILKTVIFRFVFTEIVKAVGAEAAAWLAVVAAVVGVKMKGAVPGSFAAEAANVLLTVANGLVSGISNVLQELSEDLLRDINEFDEYRVEMEEELARANELLGISVTVDPFTFIDKQPLFVAGETPANYFERTVHSGNVGVASFLNMHNYVNNALRLPTVNDAMLA